MKLFSKILFLAFLFYTTGLKGQDVSDAKHLDKLYKEAALFYVKMLKYQNLNEDSVQAAGKLAIEKYKEIYKLDATRKTIGDYIADCYRYTRNYDSAIIWSRHQLGVFKDSFNISSSNELLALSFILNGSIDSSKKYLKTAYIMCPRADYDQRLFTPIVFFAEKLYTGSDSLLLNSLKKKLIDPCAYSIQILKTLLPYADMVKNYLMQNLTEKYITERGEKCLKRN